MSLGVQSVSLAHELSLEEVVSIGKHNPDIEILVHGYFSILYSRRPLVTNYLEAVNKTVCSLPCHYDLIEQTREQRMPIVQDETVHVSLVKCQSTHYRKCGILHM